MRVIGKKVSLERPPAMENLWCLPDISEFNALMQAPSEEWLFKAVNREFGALSDSSVRNLRSSKGIKRSLFKKSFAFPIFRALGVEGRRNIKQMCTSVFSDYPVQVRNTAEWRSAVYDLPVDSCFKRFIQQRSASVLQGRAIAKEGLSFSSEKDQANYLYRFHSDTSNVPDELLRDAIYNVLPKLLRSDVTLKSLMSSERSILVRFLTAARQDFYLGLLATQPCAIEFESKVFPRYLEDCQSNVEPSMVRSVLEWFKDELRFNSWDSFGSTVAAPPGTSSAEDYDIDYSKDRMKKWVKSSCNCRCESSAKCKHSGLSVEWMMRISARVASKESRLKDLDVVTLLRLAKMLDNLQAELLRAVRPQDTEDQADHESASNEYQSQIKRFQTYIDCYGVS